MDEDFYWSRMWNIRVWDGFNTREYSRYGTYEQVTAHLRAAPEHHIWSAT